MGFALAFAIKQNQCVPQFRSLPVFQQAFWHQEKNEKLFFALTQITRSSTLDINPLTHLAFTEHAYLWGRWLLSG